MNEPTGPLPRVMLNRTLGERLARCVPPAEPYVPPVTPPFDPAEQDGPPADEDRGHAR